MDLWGGAIRLAHYARIVLFGASRMWATSYRNASLRDGLPRSAVLYVPYPS